VEFFSPAQFERYAFSKDDGAGKKPTRMVSWHTVSLQLERNTPILVEGNG